MSLSLIHHFIHLYFFTEFEIFFYIYYILPYEKQLVYKMFSLSNYDDSVITLLDNLKTHNYDKQCTLEQLRIDENHNKLWTYCFIYIVIMNVLLLLFFVKDLVVCYRGFYLQYGSSSALSSLSSLSSLTSLSSLSSISSLTLHNQTKYKKTDLEFEMNDLESADKRLKETDSVTIIKNKSFGSYYWNKSEFFAATCKTIQFIILIGIFEYLFFIFIVNKYKVVSAKLLLCKLIQG